jgi:lipid-binding SYLF domain-containing protein
MIAAIAQVALSNAGFAGSADGIDEKSRAALEDLYATTPAAKKMGAEAKGILVFPQIGKGGFLVAGSYGTGALYKDGATAGYYNTVEVSYGFQAGIEKYAYALFFMTDNGLAYLDKSGGFELGAGPSLTIVDEGFSAGVGTTKSRDDIYGFVFSQEGLMGGIGIKGSKITRVHPEK